MIRWACIMLVCVLVARGALVLGGGSPISTALWLLLCVGALVLVVEVRDEEG